MNNLELFSILRANLEDAPVEVKNSYNTLLNYFSNVTNRLNDLVKGFKTLNPNYEGKKLKAKENIILGTWKCSDKVSIKYGVPAINSFDNEIPFVLPKGAEFVCINNYDGDTYVSFTSDIWYYTKDNEGKIINTLISKCKIMK